MNFEKVVSEGFWICCAREIVAEFIDMLGIASEY
jgi:hypothetical protein